MTQKPRRFKVFPYRRSITLDLPWGFMTGFQHSPKYNSPPESSADQTPVRNLGGASAESGAAVCLKSAKKCWSLDAESDRSRTLSSLSAPNNRAAAALALQHHTRVAFKCSRKRATSVFRPFLSSWEYTLKQFVVLNTKRVALNNNSTFKNMHRLSVPFSIKTHLILFSCTKSLYFQQPLKVAQEIS